MGRWDDGTCGVFVRNFRVNKFLHYKARWIWKCHENFVPSQCQWERWNGRGKQRKLSPWPSRKFSLGRPQNEGTWRTSLPPPPCRLELRKGGDVWRRKLGRSSFRSLYQSSLQRWLLSEPRTAWVTDQSQFRSDYKQTGPSYYMGYSKTSSMSSSLTSLRPDSSITQGL